MATRYNINDFALANPAYVGATVSFWTVSGGAKTATLATLYAASTGSTTLSNPRTLDSDGKFSVPVYVEVPTIATVSGLTVADHDTGIMGLAEVAAAASAAASAASAAVALVSKSNAETAETNSAASAAAALVSENNAAATLAAALPKAGGTMTGDLTMGAGKALIFEGTTDNAFETTLTVVDPTADNVVTLPNATCTVAGTDIDQAWTGSPRATPVTDNDGSLDMNAGLDFLCTPSAGFTLTFTNITQGQRGSIYLVNGSNYAIAAAATTKVTSSELSLISATGEYWLSYWSPDGTNVLVVAAGDFA